MNVQQPADKQHTPAADTRQRIDLLAQAIDLGRQAQAQLLAVAMLDALGREVPPGTRARALDLSARSARLEAAERILGPSATATETTAPTWTPPPVPVALAEADAPITGPRAAPPAEVLARVRSGLALVNADRRADPLDAMARDAAAAAAERARTRAEPPTEPDPTPEPEPSMPGGEA